MHAARILLHASLAVLEAFKLEGRLVVPATFGGPMQSKFRLFVGSLLLLALPAFGQASEPTPAAATAAPVVEMEGSGASGIMDELLPLEPTEYGDGVYALRLRSKRLTDVLWDTVGFVRVVNSCSAFAESIAEAQGACDQSEWVLSVNKMKDLGKDSGGKDIAAELPLPEEYDSELVFVKLGELKDLSEAAAEFSKKSEGKNLAGDAFNVFRVISIRTQLEGCGARIKDLKCPEVRRSIDSNSPAPK